MDEAAWGALALTLTLLGGLYTWFAYRRRGLAAGMRGAALTLLPVAAWVTDVLKLLTRIGDAVGDWAIKLAVSPSLWVGVALGGVSVVLFVVSGFLANRDIGTKPRRAEEGKKAKRAAPKPGELPAAPPASAPLDSGVDAEMAEIEAILRNRGIT
jgi:hypothetical protein